MALGTKSAVCAHGIEVWEKVPRVRRNALQNATRVLTPTKSTAESVVDVQGVAASRVRVLPWALDPDFETKLVGLAGVSVPGDFPKGRVVLSVGRWDSTERYKGMDTLIKALPRLLLHRPEVQLVLVGEGDDQAWLENIARDSGVQKHVHFMSGLTYGQLSACYAAAEIFALPSRGEGFGLVYLEAMARGKPVIAGAHGGAPEVVRDGVTGYLVQHGETEQLATSIEALLANPELAQKMGARGKERVEREFRFNVFAKEFKKILRELCES